MEKVSLGNQGLKVSRMGLGCMGMSDFYKGQVSEEESIKTILYGLDKGVNFLDTADMYGPFTNELLIGKAIKGRRKDVIIATKFGVERGSNGEFLGINGKPEYLKKCCEDSLKRLKVECIDLYYQHRVDPRVPIEETVGAMSELVKEGKVKYLGLSEPAAETIRRAHKIHPLTAVQSEYSLWSRDPENEVLDVLRELTIGLVAYSPLGRGFLTGKIKEKTDLAADDCRLQSPRFMGDNFDMNLELEIEIEKMAKNKMVTPAQLALAWILSKGDDIVPIPGTRRIERLKENMQAVNVLLSLEEVHQLEGVFSPQMVRGNRYGDMSAVNR